MSGEHVVVFDPNRHCGAKNRAGQPCRLTKGQNTDHPGSGRCKLHGGRTPNGKKAAGAERARTALAVAMRSPSLRDVLELVDRGALTGDAKAALREMLGVALWREQALRLTAERTAGPLFAADPAGVYRAHPLWDMHADAIKATAVIAKMLTDQETADDFVDVERAKLRVIADHLNAAFSEVGVPAEMQDAVMRAMVARMRPLTAMLPSGPDLS